MVGTIALKQSKVIMYIKLGSELVDWVHFGAHLTWDYLCSLVMITLIAWDGNKLHHCYERYDYNIGPNGFEPDNVFLESSTWAIGFRRYAHQGVMLVILCLHWSYYPFTNGD